MAKVNVELSRRAAQAKMSNYFFSKSMEFQSEFADAVSDAKNFEALPVMFQIAILESEKEIQQRIIDQKKKPNGE